ncbi:MAG TPA: putative lipid II flippase FtsW [Longimicrobiales bacterium]|nr:putative lipid II flippase FtsW [Longimicrobiales bacterium]
MAGSAAVTWGDASGRSASRIGTGWEGAALLLLTFALLCFGMVMVYSASAIMAQSKGLPDYYFVVRQILGAALGFILLVVTALLDYRRLRLWAWPILFGTLALLLVTIVPGTQAIAPPVNGARRWIGLGPLHIQPGEWAKFAVVVWTAMLAVKKQDRLPSLSRGLLPFLTVWGLVALLILLQPNLSSAMLVLLMGALVVFAAGARIGHFILLAVVGLPVLWTQVQGAAYRMKRIAAFLDPSNDATGISYQINQSLLAVGSGGLFGRGFGRGLQKFGYLPEPHNDFLFAMISEELGFVALIALVLLYGAFALVGYRIAKQAPDLFGFLLAVGLTNLIAVQGFLHMAVDMALVPTTGVTLPFMSYGPSSVLVCMAAVGTLMSIARAADGREG